MADGTPRDCSSSSCGSQDDTAIIRDDELGTDEASALGRTETDGPVDPAKNIAAFMGDSGSATNGSAKRGFLDGLLGGGRFISLKSPTSKGLIFGVYLVSTFANCSFTCD